MSDYKHIHIEEVPRWYELGWQASPVPAILIRVKNEVLLQNSADLGKLMQRKAESIKTSFVCDLEKEIGFGDLRIYRRESKDGFESFEFPIPYLRSEPEVCPSCKGTGKDHFGEDKCYACNGTKETKGYLWVKGRHASATVATFLDVLHCDQTKITGKPRQLMDLQLYWADREMHNCPLACQISPRVVKWLATQSETQLTESMAAMRLAYEKMSDKPKRYSLHYRAWIGTDGRFHMDVPGDCACLGSMDLYALKEKTGAEYHTHNVDTPLQQLSLAAGVASLHDWIRKEID